MQTGGERTLVLRKRRLNKATVVAILKGVDGFCTNYCIKFVKVVEKNKSENKGTASCLSKQ